MTLQAVKLHSELLCCFQIANIGDRSCMRLKLPNDVTTHIVSSVCSCNVNCSSMFHENSEDQCIYSKIGTIVIVGHNQKVEII